MNLTFEPHWTPLETLAKSDSRVKVDEFMFMATAHVNNEDALKIHLYKHHLTRRYINLDDAGNFYVYAARIGDGQYIRTLDTDGVIVPAMGLYSQP